MHNYDHYGDGVSGEILQWYPSKLPCWILWELHYNGKYMNYNFVHQAVVAALFQYIRKRRLNHDLFLPILTSELCIKMLVAEELQKFEEYFLWWSFAVKICIIFSLQLRRETHIYVLKLVQLYMLALKAKLTPASLFSSELKQQPICGSWNTRKINNVSTTSFLTWYLHGMVLVSLSLVDNRYLARRYNHSKCHFRVVINHHVPYSQGTLASLNLQFALFHICTLSD